MTASLATLSADRLWSGPIAQRLEPPAHNRPVPGSNPGGPIFARCPVKMSRRSARREGGLRLELRHGERGAKADQKFRETRTLERTSRKSYGTAAGRGPGCPGP